MWHCCRVSTNLIKQISRRFQEGFFKKIQDVFALLRPPSESSPQPNRNLRERHKLPRSGPGRSLGRKRVLVHLELTNAVDLWHLTQKFPGGPIKFQEISRISRSCRHPVLSWLVQWLGVGLVIERSLVRLPAGVLSSQLGQLSPQSLRGR